MADFQAYFDESSSEDELDLFALSGFVYERGKSAVLDSAWAQLLTDAGTPGQPLPFFHMASCAHGSWPFDKLDPSQRDLLARQALQIIKENATILLSASVCKRDYQKWASIRGIRGSHYAWCVWACLVGVMAWSDKVGNTDDVAYIFESGYAKQSEVNGIMQRLFALEEFKVRYRYGGHHFVPKVESRPVQTADIPAWHHIQEARRQWRNQPMRKDFEALVRAVPNRVLHAQEYMFDDEEFIGAYQSFVTAGSVG